MLLRAVVLLLSLLGLLGPGTAVAAERITCESLRDRHQYCRIDTHNRVRLVEEYSRNRCREGRTWGYDRRGVWVDEGCRGEFRVGRRGDGDRRDRDDRDDDDVSVGQAVAAAVIVGGLAAIAAAAGDSDDEAHYDGRHDHGVPDWAVGTFEGYNRNFGAPVRLRVAPHGKVVARVEGQRFRGHWEDGNIVIGRNEFRVRREGRGFRTIERGDRNNVVHYTRIR